MLPKGEVRLRVLVVLVVEKDPPDAAALPAVLVQKVIVSPLLEFGVVRGVVLVAHVLQRLVERRNVLVNNVPN